MKTNLDIAIELTRGERGGFMRALGSAYCVADSHNQRRLEMAFPHVFTDVSTHEPWSLVVVGNALDGLEFVGPFSSSSDAVQYAENFSTTGPSPI